MDPRVQSSLVDRQASVQLKIENTTVAAAAGIWRGVRNWRDPDEIATAAARVGELSRSGSKSSAALTDSYMARVLSDVVGGGPVRVGVVRTGVPLRDGVLSYSTLYERVPQTVGYVRSTGAPLGEAITQGLARSDAMIRTDLALARRLQAHDSLIRQTQVIGYRRVIRPYVSKTGTCGLCIAAADRVYGVEELMPLHDRCQCIVLPVTRYADPGGTLNDLDLAEVYASSTSNRARDLREVRVRVEMHGELGPRLVNAGHRSTTPGERTAARKAAGKEPVTRPDTAARERAYAAAARAAR